MSLTDLIGVAAVAAAASQFVPQALRTARSRNTAGVSAGMYGLLLAQGGSWIAYGLRKGLAAPVVTNLMMIACGVVMVRLLVLNRAPRMNALFGAIAASVVVNVLLYAYASTSVLGVFAAALACSMVWPQVVVALRTGELSGLAASSWVISVVGSVLWMAYGIGKDAPVVWLSAGQNLVLSLVILGRMSVVGARYEVRVAAAVE